MDILNNELLETYRLTEATKHFMTKIEREKKFELCSLLVKNNHREYAKRFWELDLNLVSAAKEPKFVAAISFDEATVYLSDAFFNGDPKIFEQLDTVMRHELAHNLMMHQIRMMHVFKKAFEKDNPEEAYEQLKYSASMHELLNWLEDFEISNKRYTAADKELARAIKLNGRTIHGLVTEDHRDNWLDMSLESMYAQLSTELAKINSELRNNPAWQPVKPGTVDEYDELSYKSALMINGYMNPDTYSVLGQMGISLQDIEADSGDFSKAPPVVKRVLKTVYDAFKTFKDDGRQAEVKQVLKDIADTAPEERVDIIIPSTGDKVTTLYSADFKILVSNLLKKIIEEPIKLSQAFVDAWTKVMEIVAPEDLSNDQLTDLLNKITS